MKQLTIYISCVLLLCSTSSCKKFLDEKPISVSTDKTFWKDESDADKSVAAAYALLRKSLNNADGIAYYAYGDLPTDEYTTNEFRFSNVSNVNWSIAIPASETWDRMMRLRRYDFFYSAIDQTNRCIANIPAIPDGKFSSALMKNNLVGEAYFLRAFNYFYMARVWGDVPLVTESVNPIEAVDIPRTSQDLILDQCIKDVNMAISLLTWDYPTADNRAVRANKGAAYALLAHIYAWKGDYSNCNTAANAVIDADYYHYVDRNNYLDIFKGKSAEGIFEIAQSAENEGTELGISFYTLKSPYLTTVRENARFTINSTALTALFNNNLTDLRLKNAFALLNTTNPICIKYSNITYSSGQNVVTGVAHNNMIIFRLADIKLLKAEALAALAQYEPARAILNEVRARADLGNWVGTDEQLFEGIIDERGRELFLEGHRFYDLVRLGRKGIFKFGESKMSSGDFTAGKYYWPLDPTLININKKLRQTPYWSSKM